MKRRIGGIFLALALCLTLLPTVAFAAGGTGKAIQMGPDAIAGYDSTSKTYNYIYYGVWQNQPIKWRVLDTKDNTDTDGALFLLTDECMGSSNNGYIQFNPADKADRYLWKGSTVQTWCTNFYNTAFTDAERALIPPVTQANSEYLHREAGTPSYNPAFKYQTGGLEAEHVFAPSIQEINNANYGFATGASRIAGPYMTKELGSRYWIRSYFNNLPHYVGELANMTGDQIATSAAVRPAMNLSTTDGNILFISEATGGKPSGGLKAVSNYNGSEWKLTLKDSNRSGFNVTTKEVSTFTVGGNISIAYSGAKTGTNEYVSVLILDDNGNPTYYGRSSASLSDENGMATIAVPAGLAVGTYILKVFNEQYNGDNKTDYAGEFTDVTLNVEKAVTYTVTYDPGENGTGTEFTDTKIEGFPLTLADKSKAFTRPGYTQTGWAKVDGGEKDYGLGAIYEKDEAITLYPAWTANQYTVTLNPNGGDSITSSEVTVTYDQPLNGIPVPKRLGYVFDGWYDAQVDGKCYVNSAGKSTNNYDKAENCTLYAHWQKTPDCTVTFDPNGGSPVSETATVAYGGTLIAPVTQKTGYHLEGWYNGETKWNFITDTVTSSMTLKARWTANSYAITYDLDGGTAGENSPATHTYGTPTVIPTPTRSGYTFAGWLVNDSTDAVKALTLGATDYTSAISLKATWTVISSGGSYTPTYPVNTPSKIENGSVSVSPKNASKGDTVTITVKPDSGYELETITATDKNGNDLKLTGKGNGKYTFTMPAGKVDVNATFMEDNSLLNFFYDVPNGAYYYEAVKWAVENGITGGIGNNLFGPEQPCTRAQIVTFLWRAAGSPEPKAMSSFSDVPADSYYAKAVAWAVENGITTGTSAETFSPDATCTRAQAVTFLARALNAKASGKAEFADVPVDSYFAEAVAWAASNGVTEGVGNGLFAPDNNCTRGQIVTFLWRAYNK